MKGPEIHFPITIESADSAARKKIALQREAHRQETERPVLEEE